MKALFLLCLNFLLIHLCYAVSIPDKKPPPPPFWEILTIHGVDSDDDGVRDDVEIWIDKICEDYNLRMSLKAIAISYKRLLETVDNKEQYLVEKKRFNLRSFCWDFVSLGMAINPLKITHQLEDKMLNSPLRKYYFRKGFSNLPEGVLTMPNVPTHLYGVACDFEISNPKKIIEKYLSVNPQYEWDLKRQKEFEDVYETKSLVIDPYTLFSIEQRGK